MTKTPTSKSVIAEKYWKNYWNFRQWKIEEFT